MTFLPFICPAYIFQEAKIKNRELQTASTLMQLAETSIRAIEKEREAAANAGRLLEAEREKAKLEREKKGSLLADCEGPCEELEDVSGEKREGDAVVCDLYSIHIQLPNYFPNITALVIYYVVGVERGFEGC